MSESESSRVRCNRCGAPLPVNAPEGLCPRCVMALNLATETEFQTGEVGAHGTVANKQPPAPPLPVSEVAALFPQLEILESLGRGGMGAVYKARQPRLDRIVALKILSPEKQGDPKFAERFEREARTLARLTHPNIVMVYDFGEVGGHFYLLMEYVDGMTLRQLFRNRKLSPEEAVAIVPSICEALQYAHQRGVVHRDIKPENILLDKAGQVKIADFGIAKIVAAVCDRPDIGEVGRAGSPLPAAGGLQTDAGAHGVTRPADALTDAGKVLGTPNYMAPEQVEKPQLVDHRADIYSLGVVFYEMLTGELPLGKFAPPSKKVQIDVRLDEVVLHALEKEPERRYQQASEVKTDVETIAGTAAASRSSRRVEARTETSRVEQASSGRWLAIAGWSAVVLSLLVLLGFVVNEVVKKRHDASRLLAGIGTNAVSNAPVERKFVRLVVTTNQMTFEAQPVTWDTLGALLQAVPDRAHTVLEWAVTTDQITVQQKNEWMFKCGDLAKLNGFEYASFIGVHRMGSKGGEAEASHQSVAPPANIPPVVVQTIPESGDASVDPSLTELRVTFSKPMQDGSWSWSMWGEENYPETTGAPSYLGDQRTCVLPVKLKPGKLYAIWLNSEKLQNFKDQSGQPSVPYLLIFQTKN